ncbi:MAG: hypothetical protein ABI183_05285 [Polyangiaceae bacterium]
MSILALLPIAKWHSAPSCDARTHIEMIRGVADHGLPYGENGPIGRFPEFRARWNIVKDGKLWGTYPPLFAYIAAPIFRMGGLPAVSRMNIVFLIVMAFAVFVLARRFLGDALLAAAAAWLVVCSTPVPATAMDMSPYIISESLIVFAMAFALASIDGSRSRISACFSGVLSGLAVSAHLLTFPMFAGLLIAVVLANANDQAGRLPFHVPEIVEPWIPTRASLVRAGVMLAGFVVALLPVAALNLVRFHSPNPISYGPCPWRSCAETGQDVQHLSDILLYALPTLAWVGTAVVIFCALKKNSIRVPALLLCTIFPMIAWKLLRTHAWQILVIAWGNVVDLSFVDMEIGTMPDKIGHLLGPWLIRSALQTTPFIALSFLVPWCTLRERRRTLVLALPSLCLFISCALRANEPPAFAFGFPFVFLRYTVPATAPLLILALASVRDLRWRGTHVALTVVTSGVIAFELWSGKNFDGPLDRRIFLLYGTLLSAVVACVAVWLARKGHETPQKIAPFAIGLAMALGVGPTLGETLHAEIMLRNDNDARLDSVAAMVPDRFALVGFAGEIDTALALRATRDVQYIDLYETDQSKGWATFRAMIDEWTRDGRPIFALWPAGTDPPSPWTDVAFERIMAKENLYRIRKL